LQRGASDLKVGLFQGPVETAGRDQRRPRPLRAGRDEPVARKALTTPGQPQLFDGDATDVRGRQERRAAGQPELDVPVAAERREVLRGTVAVDDCRKRSQALIEWPAAERCSASARGLRRPAAGGALAWNRFKNK